MLPEDAEGVSALGQSTPELAASDVSRFWGAQRLKKWVESGSDVMLVAEENGEIVGVQLTQIHHPSSVALLSDIFVRKDMRGQGVGRRLHQEVMRRISAIGIDYVYALTHTDNGAIHDLLEKEGFSRGETFFWYEFKFEQNQSS